MIFARKINKNSGILRDFARKMPEFYVIIARQIFSPVFVFFWRGGGVPSLPPVSYAYGPTVRQATVAASAVHRCRGCLLSARDGRTARAHDSGQACRDSDRSVIYRPTTGPADRRPGLALSRWKREEIDGDADQRRFVHSLS